MAPRIARDTRRSRLRTATPFDDEVDHQHRNDKQGQPARQRNEQEQPPSARAIGRGFLRTDGATVISRLRPKRHDWNGPKRRAAHPLLRDDTWANRGGHWRRSRRSGRRRGSHGRYFRHAHRRSQRRRLAIGGRHQEQRGGPKTARYRAPCRQPPRNVMTTHVTPRGKSEPTVSIRLPQRTSGARLASSYVLRRRWTSQRPCGTVATLTIRLLTFDFFAWREDVA